MDPRIAEIAAAAVAFLAPYLAEGGKAAAKKGGAALIAALERKFKGKPTAEEALQDVKAAPQNKGAQSALAWQLEKAARADPAFLAELTRLLAAVQPQVSITGDGNVVGDNNRVVVAKNHSIAAGGDFVGRDKIVHEFPRQVLEMFARQFGFDPAASDAQALSDYFNNVILERHSKLSFLFIRPETGQVYTEADVETVFVPLRITNPKAARRRGRGQGERFGSAPDETEEETRPVTLPELLNEYDCFLLRGKPGSGKTTLLRHVALAFARGEQEEKLDWHGPAPLPLLVPLRNLGAFLKKKEYVGPQPRALFEYLEEHLRGAQVGFSPDFLRRRLENGECLLLLDALDEVAGVLDGGGDLRKQVARQVAAFIEHYRPKGNRFILTSRPRAYREEGAIRQALPQPEICDLLDLSPEGYGRLTTNLLVVLTGDETAGRAEAQDLLARIAPNRQLADLAGNPLLCTTLVLVYKYRGRKLPERRVDVLHEIVTLLLGRWEEERRNVTAPEELALMGVPERTTERAIRFRRRALSTLAWHMQQTSAAEIAAGEAVRALAAFYRDEERVEEEKTARDWADEFLLVAHERSGLFIALDEGLHAFAHQAFREYLAATYLVDQGEQALLEEVLRHAPRPDEWWEQVVLLAGAHPQLSGGAAGRLVGALLKRNDVEYAHLAARCAHDMTGQLPGRQRKELQDWLLATLRNDLLPAKERARAGDALALAGDPRPGAGLRPDGLPDIAWCAVPAGPFVMGSRKKDDPPFTVNGRAVPPDPQADDREKPVHLQDVPYDYWIARYPVTNAQFRAFVDDPDGYRRDEWWTRAGLAWRGERSGPETRGGVFDLDNHPVVEVTWHEALAYCRWLNHRMKRAGLLPDGWEVRLPGEAEWEKAARGGLQIPAPGGAGPASGSNLVPAHAAGQPQTAGQPQGLPRRGNPNPARVYPWGGNPDPNRANYRDTGIGATSAVGCFPGGASPYGVEDMSGNVWEWCCTKWEDDYEDYWGDGGLEGNALRVLRGGSFDLNLRLVRCAYRYWDDPRDLYGYLGFRVAAVASPFSSLHSDPLDSETLGG